ncbi:polyprenyl diphosphate synthase [Paenibacillus sp. 2TAB26]|uniref:polyprenyl diphosphate synthase n=1 Tax=Paenibacillus sp. 2TAB26 TaxID=3233005 RepID=UPI003F9AD4C7
MLWSHLFFKQDRYKYFPKHIAIIMDGNGRWATRKGLPRNVGHFYGMKTMQKIIKRSISLKLSCLTLYAFSTENWRRPKAEVDYLLELPIKYFQNQTIEELNKKNVKVTYIGDISSFPAHTVDVIQRTCEITKNNTGMLLNMALNYGGRTEILQAAKKLIASGADPLTFDEQFEKTIATSDYPPVDLIIRTSGEKRLSNFLLWQAAYAELWFTDKSWPDFNYALLNDAIQNYSKRKERE